MERFGLGHNSNSGGDVDVQGYDMPTRLSRRTNWLKLKCASILGGATSFGLAGMVTGVFVGGIVSITRHHNDQCYNEIVAKDSTMDGGFEGMMYLLTALACALIYGLKTSSLPIGLLAGGSIGAFIGWIRGSLIVVNPARHGFCAHFWLGFQWCRRRQTNASNSVVEERGVPVFSQHRQSRTRGNNWQAGSPVVV
jgi:hypothetical protein